MKKTLSAIIIAVLLATGTAWGLDGAADALQGYELDEWGILALYASGADMQGLGLERVEDTNISTDHEAYVMGALALGKNVEDDLLSIAGSQMESGKFADYMDGTGDELLNAHIWGMISLESAGNASYDRWKAIEWLEGQQNEDGGFPIFTGMEKSDGDMTSMALVALELAGGSMDEDARNRALDFIRENNMEKGTVEGLAWEMIARKQMGLEAGESLKRGLAEYKLENGTYMHLKTMSVGNYMATWHGIWAEAEMDSRLTVFDRLGAMRSFRDIEAGMQGYEAVSRLVGDGVLSGYPDGTFRPDAPVKRGEFVKMLAYAMKKENDLPNPNGFIDMQGHWASRYVAIAVGNRIFNGVSDDYFDPESGITGAQLAAVAVRVMGLEAEAKAFNGDSWYDGYVYYAWLHDLQYEGFEIEKEATRAQCAELIDNLYY